MQPKKQATERVSQRRTSHPIGWAIAVAIVLLFASTSYRLATACEASSVELVKWLNVKLGGCQNSPDTYPQQMPTRSTASQSESAPPPISCSLGKWDDGTCLPGLSESTSDDTKLRLYSRCLSKGGKDEYTSVCCEHLTSQLSKRFSACGR